MAKVLIVEDEGKIASLLADYFQQAGFASDIVGDGLEVIPRLGLGAGNFASEFDAVLLDLMLPGRSGLDLCRDIRARSDIPILMVTARVDEIDRLLGLELGADDYICKPFSPREVVARVKAILRRLNCPASTQQTLTLDDDSYRATVHGTALDLTAVEYQLLAKMGREPGRIFSRQQLIDSMYRDNRVVSDRTVDSHIKKLRKKISEQMPEPELIHSVYGVGYKLELP
jgi:two-component system, OmpR family, response regulator BaeR